MGHWAAVGILESQPGGGFPGPLQRAMTRRKGWDAATHMARALALAKGWEYSRHSHFHQVMDRARRLSGNKRLRLLHGRAEILYVNAYELADQMDPEIIGEDLASMTELLDLLEAPGFSPNSPLILSE